MGFREPHADPALELHTMKSAHLHWLLELMLIDPVPLAWILPSFNGQHTNSLALPNFKSEDYSRLLISALHKGLILLLSGNRQLSLDDSVATVSSFEKNAMNKPDNQVVFRLTNAGGTVWENLAEPQWGRFLKAEMTTLSSDLDDLRVSGLVASKNQDAVLAYLGWYEHLESVDVEWNTLRITTHADYEATYWKRLIDVFEATLDGVLRKTDRSVPAPVRDWQMSLDKWHVKPWDRPDWPGR
jgi:hypothetical protein